MEASLGAVAALMGVHVLVYPLSPNRRMRLIRDLGVWLHGSETGPEG